jgi:hypothetical protein
MDRPGAKLRKLTGLLLALNLGLFLAGMAWQYGAKDDSPPLLFNAEKIRLLSQPPLVARASNEPGVLAIPPAKPPGDEVVSRCLAWDRLAAAELASVEALLKQAGIDAASYDIELDRQLGWWVFLPPLETPADLRAKLEEIVALGIKDYAPVRGGSMRNAISLGTFSSLAQVREQVARLTGKGIQGIEFGPRPESGRVRLLLAESVPESALLSLRTVWPEGLQATPCTPP